MFTNEGLVNYVNNLINTKNYYIYGGFGRVITESLINAKAKQYPLYYNYSRIESAKKHIGERGFDCIGMIKSYYWNDSKNYNNPKGSDVSADGMYNKAVIKGNINTLDKKRIGLLVHMSGHIGVYIGNGEVIECTIGFNAYKIIKTKLTDRNWLHWLECPFITYIQPKKEEKIETPVNIYKGNSIVDYLKSININSSYSNRKLLAKKYGIKFYIGSAKQNITLLTKMRGF